MRRDDWRAVIAGRLDFAVERGCDGVEPDNVDGYQNLNGFRLTREDSLDFLLWMAHYAHELDLAIGLKNSPGLVPDVVDEFDFAVVEQCFQYDECGRYADFIRANKSVWAVEYELGPGAFCETANCASFDASVKTYDLADEPVGACYEDYSNLPPAEDIDTCGLSPGVWLDPPLLAAVAVLAATMLTVN